MKSPKIVRGLEFRAVLTDPFVVQFLKDKNPVAIADLGAGTNEEIGVSVLDPAPGYLNGKQVIVYLVDQNPSWLSILSQRLPRNISGLILVQTKLEQMTTKAQIFDHASQKDPWDQTPATQTLLHQRRFPQAVIDLVIFNRDMLGWLQFFNTDTDRVLKETQKILKPEGLLILTQPGLKYKHSHTLLEGYGFTLVKHCVLQLETGKRLETAKPPRMFERPKTKEYIYQVYQKGSRKHRPSGRG